MDKQTKRKYLQHIFYVYHGAADALFMAVCAILMAIDGAMLGNELQLYVANPLAAVFALAMLAGVWSIIRAERRYN